MYTEDTVTKTNDGGLNSMRNEHKVRWIHPLDDPVRCPVRLIDKYMSLCPPVTMKSMKPNFYLRSLEKYNPAQWYSTQVLGLQKIMKTVKDMLKSCDLDGFFTNHSLRRTGTSRLFQAGVDRKLVKEYSGHRSEALDQYQITSEKQKEMISNILAGPKDVSVENNIAEKSNSELESSDSNVNISCNCNKKNMQITEVNQVGSLINQLVKDRGDAKTVVRIEIEFNG